MALTAVGFQPDGGQLGVTGTTVRDHHQMRRYLVTASRLMLSIYFGVWFSSGMAICGLIQGGSIGVGLMVGGVVGGVGVGAVMGSRLWQRNQRARQMAGPLTDEQFHDAAQARLRGPIPTDTRIREAAEQLIHFRIAEYDRHRRRNLVIFAVMVVGYALLAVSGSGWWILGTLVGAWRFVNQLWAPTRLNRRLRILQNGSAAPDRERAVSR
jgi:hypothetical protein